MKKVNDKIISSFQSNTIGMMFFGSDHSEALTVLDMFTGIEEYLQKNLSCNDKYIDYLNKVRKKINHIENHCLKDLRSTNVFLKNHISYGRNTNILGKI